MQQDDHTDVPKPSAALADPVDAFLAYPFSTDAVYQVRASSPSRVVAR